MLIAGALLHAMLTFSSIYLCLGNFQATAVTQAMDATRLVLEHLGRLSFAQITELIK